VLLPEVWKIMVGTYGPYNSGGSAIDAEIKRFTRVKLWHFLRTFLFLDASDYTISWIFLDILRQWWENITTYNWGARS
jgi:hypothetical protein